MSIHYLHLFLFFLLRWILPILYQTFLYFRIDICDPRHYDCTKVINGRRNMSNLIAAVLFAVTDHRFSNKCFQTNVPEQMFEQEIFSESSEGVKNEKHPHTKQKHAFFSNKSMLFLPESREILSQKSIFGN